ncbi:MAG: WYL domain-containing protein [Candidatus Delongbacteria bacterium]
MKPQERQLTLTAYLHAHHFGRTLEEIQADIPDYGRGESGRKKFQRDRAVLRELGLPLRCVEQEGLTDDGNLRYVYLLDRREVFARGLRLSPAEQRGLLAVCDTLMDRPEFPFGDWVRSARDKLLSARSGAPVEEAVSRRLPPLPALGEKDDLSALEPVLSALERGVCLRFEYQGLHHDRPEPRTVHPWRLLAWRGTWLLRAHCELRGEPRSFLLRRMRRLELTAVPARPAPAEIESTGLAAWEVGLGEGPDAVVDFEPAVAELVERGLLSVTPPCRLERLVDGRLRATLPVEDPAAFFRWLLGWGRQAWLRGPAALQEKLADWLDQSRGAGRSA